MDEKFGGIEQHAAYQEHQRRLKKKLSLPRRQNKDLDKIIAKTAPPWSKKENSGDKTTPTSQGAYKTINLKEKEDELLEWESELNERNLFLRRTKAALDNKERAVSEREMLNKAREGYVEELRAMLEQRLKELSENSGGKVQGDAVSPETQSSFNRLKESLDDREKSLVEREELIKEREDFVEASENELFNKAQELQEKEEELASLKEELALRKQKLDVKEGLAEPEKKEVL